MSILTVTLTASVQLPSITTSTTCPTIIDAVHLYTTFLATPGQTLTINSPQTITTDYVETIPINPFTTNPIGSPTPCSTQTITATELDAALISTLGGSIWTTVTFNLGPQVTLTSNPVPGQPYVPQPIVYVVPNHPSGWDVWNTSQRAGLCAGVVILSLLLVALALWCLGCFRKRKRGEGWVWGDKGWGWGYKKKGDRREEGMYPMGYWDRGWRNPGAGREVSWS